MAHIVTIMGSPAANSRSASVLDYFRTTLESHGHTTHAIVVRDMNAQDLMHGNYNADSIKAEVAQVAAARAVILATPVYKASYTGVLKLFLDVLPTNALAGKIALPIVGGANMGHSLVLDYALKPVLAALGASTILTGAYLTDNQFNPVQPGIPPTFTPELQTLLESLCAGLKLLL